jgi:hypothetical protein
MNTSGKIYSKSYPVKQWQSHSHPLVGSIQDDLLNVSGYGAAKEDIIACLKYANADKSFPYKAGPKLHISKAQAEVLFKAGFDLNPNNVIVYHRNKSIFWDQFVSTRNKVFTEIG